MWENGDGVLSSCEANGMFMTEKEFNDTLDLMSGKKEPDSLLTGLKIWAKETLDEKYRGNMFYYYNR